MHRGRNVCLEPGKRCLDALHSRDDIGAGLLEHDEQHALAAVLPGDELTILRPAHRVANVAYAYRSAILVRDNRIVVRPWLGELVIVENGE